VQSIGLVLCIHCSSPPGLTGEALRRAFECAYLPLIEALEDAPDLKITLHFSGDLLEWLESYAREHLKSLEAMVTSGRIEVLGGLFGGGVIPALPERDIEEQVRRMARWWRRHGDPRIRGACLPQGAWDPDAARIFGGLGLEFTILEQIQLQGATTDGWWLTERQGTRLALFAADERLSRMIPDATPAHILAEIDRRAREGSRFLVASVPGERFGAALDASATRCFGASGWVGGFFAALAENLHWLKLTDFGTVLDRLRPSGRNHPPPSLPPPAALYAYGSQGLALAEALDKARLEHSGFAPALPGWEQLLTRWPELDRLHKRMLRASQEVHRLTNSLRDQRRVAELQGEAQADLRDAWREATAALHRAQHGPALMIGTEVGAQDGSIRHDAISSLLRCEYTVAEAFEEAWTTRIEQLDGDCDGLPEVTARTPRLRATLIPARGGAMTALDIWSLPGSLLNLWSRRPEPWHSTLPEESAQLQVRRPVSLNDLLDDVGLDDLVLDESSQAALEGSTGPLLPPGPPPLPRFCTPPPLGDFLLNRNIPLDSYIRASYLDRFLDSSTTFESFVQGNFLEAGDFASGEYRVLRAQVSEPSVLDRGGAGATIELVRDGNINEGAAMRLAKITKKYRFPTAEASCLVDYVLANSFHDPIRGRFAIELNLNLDSNTGPATSLEMLPPAPEEGPFAGPEKVSLHSKGKSEVEQVTWEDQERGLKVSIKISPPAHLWRFPIETTSPTPRGLERIFQGFCLLLWWPVELWSLEERTFQVDLLVES
jgi:alpha-amylase